MKKYIFSTLFIFFILPHVCFAQMKGINVVPIKDTSGKQVCLYTGSYALIIGVSDYTAGWPKLPSVVAETKEIADALKSNGFFVHRVLNPDEQQLKQEFEQFIDTYGYEPNNRLLFYFSGHGYSRKKGAKGYLIPTNAPNPLKDEKAFLRTALPMSQVLAWCRQMEAKHALFLFDSCFSGTIFKTKALPKVPAHISAITSRPVRQFIAAGDAGEEVPAKSVFAKCFLRALHGEADLSKDGYVTGSELGMYLRDRVLYYQTGQTPQYGKIKDPDLDEGDFVFVVRPAGEPIRALLSLTPFQRDILSLADHSKSAFKFIKGKENRQADGNTFFECLFVPKSDIRIEKNLCHRKDGSWTLPVFLHAPDLSEARVLYEQTVAKIQEAIFPKWKVISKKPHSYIIFEPKQNDYRVGLAVVMEPLIKGQYLVIVRFVKKAV